MRNFAYDIKIIIEPDGDGYYAHCPGLPGVFACGNTEVEALTNANDAATSIIRTKLKLGESVQENENLKKVTSKPRPSIHEIQINFPLPVSL